MSSFCTTRSSGRAFGRGVLKPLYAFCLALLLALTASTASAQNVTEINTPTTTTLLAGTQDFVQFGLSSLTFPASGVILPGTAISKFTGRPERHLWYGDSSNGFCRIDPELDDPNLSQPSPGIGRFNNIITTCVGSIQAGAFVPMQVTYDASTNTLYAADIPRTANGLIRMHYLPAGDSGHGAVDPIHIESLMGSQATRNAAGGCPVVKDPRSGATPFTMSSASLGPDGNLYIGWMRNGTIARIPHPPLPEPYPLSANPSPTMVARAMTVIIGFTPEDAGKRLASATKRPPMPRTAPCSSHTDVRGSAPMRQVPI